MPAAYMVIDIETVLDPELPIAEASEAERLPAPPHHRVVVLGALWFDGRLEARSLTALKDGEPEPIVLEEFVRVMEERRPTVVTFNGRGFDLPVIVSRCLRHGIPFPHYFADRDMRYRFSAGGHLDLMDHLADHGAAKPARLDTVAKLCGMPGKVGVDGKDVGPLVHAGRLAEVRNYCLCDVLQTAAVFLRMQLLRGSVDRARYLEAMEALLGLARSDPRVAPVVAGWNLDRLLLRERSAAPGE